jgi:alpha-L-rhamnosidase
LDSPDDVPAAAPSKLEPSAHSALLPLWAGIVPPERLDRVRAHLFATWSATLRYPYTHAWLFEEFADADEPRRDIEALDSIRDKWAEVMRRTDTGTLTESYEGGEAAHNFGASPVHYLAAYVLGVRLDGPAKKARLLIEPRLGDLTSAEGTVVTEHGPVPVSWRLDGTEWRFALTVPAGVTARLRLPVGSESVGAVLDGRPLLAGSRGVVHRGRWLEITVGPGRHGGRWSGP